MNIFAEVAVLWKCYYVNLWSPIGSFMSNGTVFLFQLVNSC